ncbi:type II secretion system F family protein [Actinokineospora fastidiosa]|nr:type II secretion system F family protein [Actinokineospora fastidiosa]
MTTPLLALAAALLLWTPHRPAAARLRRLFDMPKRSPPRITRAVAVGVATGASASALAHPLAGLAAGPAAWLLVHRLRRGRAPTLGFTTAAGFDLLAACLAAGMPVPTAVRVVAGHFPPHVAAALTGAADLLALGAAPRDAWSAVACPEIAPLARGASRSARSGTALADLARGLARRAREQAVDAAEARAQRAAVLIAGPLGLCFLPAFLCLGIAPVVIGMATTLL